ncbi:MAG: hypothetical protein R2796_07660 [Chitinophagaceae bacterium]|nr:hypothetical protein [Chitinophagaceae bacterium]
MIMKYENEVYSKIELVNSVLESLNVSSLESNKDFIIDESFHQEHYVKFLLQKPSCIELQLIFISNALQINIDRTNESFEWSDKQIQENINDVKGFIKMLFTSTIKVEYCGSNYTKLYFYDVSGNCVKTLKYVTGLYLKFNCKTKEYKPIYTK